MTYPVAYSMIGEEEMTYIAGGSPDYAGLFDYLIGNYLRDIVLSDARSVVWNSATSTSFDPVVNWAKNFWNMGIVGKAGYIYGMFNLGKTIMSYLDK